MKIDNTSAVIITFLLFYIYKTENTNDIINTDKYIKNKNDIIILIDKYETVSVIKFNLKTQDIDWKFKLDIFEYDSDSDISLVKSEDNNIIILTDYKIIKLDYNTGNVIYSKSI